MTEINSLRGLNNVSVDFRPTITTNEQKTGNTNALLPEAQVAPEDAPLEKGNAKSVVRELDVLLLNAASKSVSTNTEKKVDTIATSLFEKGLLTSKESSMLKRLAADAHEKLKALDKFSGRDLAKALMQDKKTGETVWSKGLFGLSSAAKAVKAAIEAQQTLSTELGKFNLRLARADEDVVDDKLQDTYTELQFQCDRRASEIDSVVFRMYDLAQKDVVSGASTDPQTKALLNATFQELMPREAILMHGTKEAFEKLNATMGEQMRPLAQKLDAFAAGSSKVLGQEELRALRRDIAKMKNALANVRANGIEVTHTAQVGSTNVTHTEVDKSLLDGMEKILDDASQQLAHARSSFVSKARDAFLKEVNASLSPEAASGGQGLWFSGNTNPILFQLMELRNEFVKTLNAFATGKLPMKKFDTVIDACIAKFNQAAFGDLDKVLEQYGVDPSAAKSISKAARGLHFIKAQFKELMESTENLLKDGAEFGIATSDVRRIMLGEKRLSNVVEAKIRGFQPGDVDPAADESNIVSSKELGAGSAGKTYLLTTKSGEELVFKPEMDSRIGLDDLLLGAGNAYLNKQKTANLNLATQDTAKAFGCEDLVVKYSVGSHNGQFGFFMDKAKGVPGSGYVNQSTTGGGGIPPSELHQITDRNEQTKIKGNVAQKLNRLMWLDLITGQGDRHWGNYFVHIDPTTHEVTVKGIDNDASFSATRIGLMKFAFNKEQTALYEAELKSVCQKIHGSKWKTEFNNRVKNDPAIVRDGNTMTIDLTKAKSHEAKMAIIKTLGLQTISLPEEIDQDFYNKLMEMADPAKKQAYLDSIKSRVSPEALQATSTRIDEAIAYAKKLKAENKVYGQAQWQNAGILSGMTKMQTKVEIQNSNGNKIEVKNDLECVSDFCERNCPSFYKRDGFHLMFQQPQPA